MTKKIKVETRQLTPEELLNLFRGSQFERIIGVEETPNIDFKRELYDLTSADKQFEFAKDIAAIANSGGGLICIGFNNGENTEKLVSFAASLVPLVNHKTNFKQLSQILKNKLIPRLPDDLVNYEYFGDKKEYLVLVIKETPSELMPLIVAEKNNQMEYFLCPFRNGADTETFLHSRKLHEYISSGYKGESSQDANELTEIKNTLNLILERLSITENEKASEESDKDIIKYIDYAKDKIAASKGFFYMMAVPNSPVLLSNFWDKSKNNVYEILLNPPHLRKNGWDMSTATDYGEMPYPTANRWESMNGTRKLNVIDTKGVLFSAGAIDDFLDWGVSDYRSTEKFDGSLINNFALVEYIDVFAHTLLVFKELTMNFSSYQIQVGFVLPDNPKIGLLRPFHIAMYHPSIIGPNVSAEVKVELLDDEKIEPKYLAGRIVEAVNSSIFGNADSQAYLGHDENGAFVEEERYTKV